jgi:hypothetical protein
MTDEIRKLLDYLVMCKGHIEHGVYRLAPYWQGEYDRTRDELADVWANEMEDAQLTASAQSTASGNSVHRPLEAGAIAGNGTDRNGPACRLPHRAAPE